MTPAPAPQSNSLPEWFDPFPEPRTMPGGWNLSGLLVMADKPPRVEAALPGHEGEQGAGKTAAE